MSIECTYEIAIPSQNLSQDYHFLLTKDSVLATNERDTEDTFILLIFLNSNCYGYIAIYINIVCTQECG